MQHLDTGKLTGHGHESTYLWLNHIPTQPLSTEEIGTTRSTYRLECLHMHLPCAGRIVLRLNENTISGDPDRSLTVGSPIMLFYINLIHLGGVFCSHERQADTLGDEASI